METRFLPEMHDTTLVSILIDWASRSAALHLKSENTRVKVLNVSGLRSLEVPMEYPWGPSASINTVAHSVSGRDHILAVEMQSGDIIKLMGQDVAITEP